MFKYIIKSMNFHLFILNNKIKQYYNNNILEFYNLLEYKNITENTIFICENNFDMNLFI